MPAKFAAGFPAKEEEGRNPSVPAQRVSAHSAARRVLPMNHTSFLAQAIRMAETKVPLGVSRGVFGFSVQGGDANVILAGFVRDFSSSSYGDMLF